MCALYENEAMETNGYNLGPQRSISQVQFIGERISALALKRHVRKDAVRLCDCIVTLPRSFDDSREREFFKTAYTFLSQRYGVDNVVSAYVHRNSSRPHMHFAWVPVTKDGRLSAKSVVTRLELKTLHPDMQRFMESSLGCKVEILLDSEKAGERMGEFSLLPGPGRPFKIHRPRHGENGLSCRCDVRNRRAKLLIYPASRKMAVR